MQNDCFPNSPPEWDKGPVKAIAEVNPRYAVRKDVEYPFIEMASVAEDFGGILRFGKRKMESSGLSRFKAADTLFAKITPCPENGKVAFVHSLPDELGIGSTEFIVLSPRDGCHPRFLYHLLCCHDVRGRAAARMEGSTGRQRVPDDVFENRLLVPIPRPEEQAAIARILDAVDTAIEQTREAVERARDVKHALVQRLFTKGTRHENQKRTAIGWIPGTWEVVSLKSVVAEFQYGLSVPMDGSGDIPILRMGNIQAGDVLLSGLKYVSLPPEIVASYRVKTGDMLFNRTNSQELVGKVGIYRSDKPAVFASYLIRLKHDPKQLDNYFLGQLLDSYSLQCRIKRFATPGVQQVNVNAKNLGKALIPLPSGACGLQEQREIAAILEQADAAIRSYGPKLESQQALKRALMHDLLTGKVRVNHLGRKSVLGP